MLEAAPGAAGTPARRRPLPGTGCFPACARLRSTRGFTLVEIVVTLVILGILAGIGIASYSAVNKNARNTSTETNLATVAQSVQALAEAEDRKSFVPNDVKASISDLTAAAAGVSAAGGSESWSALEGAASTRYREVSFAIAPNAANVAGQVLQLAVVTPVGDCSFLRAELGKRAETWTVEMSDEQLEAARICRAANAKGPDVPPSDTAAPGPLELTATSGQDRQIPLSWTPSTGATGYRIFLTGTNSVVYEGSTLSTTVTEIPSQTAGSSTEPLVNGRSYSFEIIGFNADGQSPRDEASATPNGAPNAPVLTAKPGDGVVTLTWTASPSPGVTEYRLTRTAPGPLAAGTVTVPAGQPLTYVDRGLQNGTVHTYEVVAVVAGPPTQVSPPGTASATPSATPSAPVLSGTAGDGENTLTWAASTSGAPTSYRLYLEGSASPIYSGPLLSFDHRGLQNGKSYTYRVTGVNSFGEGPRSNAVTLTPRGGPAAPTASARAGDAQVTVSWTHPDPAGQDVVAYRLYLEPSSPTATRQLLEETAGLSYPHTELQNGTTYTYTVEAVDSRNRVSPPSAPVKATPTGGLAGPVLIGTPGDGEAFLDWTRPSTDVTAYDVYQRVRGGTFGAPVRVGDPNVTARTVTGLQNGTTYEFRVDAVYSATTSAPSNVSSVTPGTVPGVPQNLASTRGDGLLNLTWDAPAGPAPTGYAVYYTPGNTPVAASVDRIYVGSTDAATRALTVGSLENFADYTLYVEAFNASGSSDRDPSSVNSSRPGSSPVVADASHTNFPGLAPGAPTITSAVPGDGTIALSWTPPATGGRPSGYIIYRGTAPGGGEIARTTGALTLGDSGLQNWQTQTYEVRAINRVTEEGGATSPRSAPRQATPRSVPTNITATPSEAQRSSPPAPMSDRQVRISWTAASGVPSGHRVYVTDLSCTPPPENPAACTTPAPDVTAGTNTTVITGLTNFREYSFSVHAYGGQETAGSVESLPGRDPVKATPRVAVGDLRSTASRTGAPGTVTLTWVAPSGDFEAYRIRRDSITGPVIATAPRTATSATVPAPELWNSYTYFVEAHSPTASAFASTAATTSTPVTGLAVTATTDRDPGVYTLSWNPAATPGTPTGYRVYENGVLAATVPFGTNTTTLSRSPFVTRTYTVRAYSASVESDDSNSVAETAAAPPSALVLTPASTQPNSPADTPFSDSQVRLSWTAPSAPPTGYRVFRDGTLIATVTAPATAYTATGLTNFREYTFEVRAFGGTVVRESTANPTGRSTPRAPVTGLTITTTRNVSPGSVSISWTEPSGVNTGYRIFRGPDFTTPVADLPRGTTTRTLTGISVWDPRVYRVQAYAPTATASVDSAARTPVAPPTGVSPSATNSGAGTINVSWTAAPGSPPQYRVYSEGGPAATVSTTSSSFASSSFVSRGIQVSGYNGALDPLDRESDRSPSAVPTTAPPRVTPATEPSYIVAARGASDGTIDVSFGAATNCTTATSCSYEVHRDGVFNRTITSTNAASYAFQDSGLNHNQTYNYTVRATGGSNPTRTSVFRGTGTATACYRPDQVTGVYTTSKTSSSISIAWNTSARATSYAVYRNGGFVGSTASTSYTDSGLAASTSYTYTVVASNACGSATASLGHTDTTNAPPCTVPGTPLNVTATASGEFINVSWTANGGSAAGYGYHVQASFDGVNFFDFSQSYPGNVTSISDYVGYDATRTFRVRAFNDCGTSAFQNSNQATTGSAPPPACTTPSAPQNASVASISSSQLRITWSAPASGGPVSGYDLYWSSSGSAGTFNYFASVGSGTFSFDDNISSGTTRAYQIVATSACGSSPPAQTNTITQGGSSTPPPSGSCTSAPTQPGAISASSPANTQLSVSWGASGNNPVDYVVTATESQGRRPTQSTTTTGTSATINNLDGNVRYDISVVARNSCGTSSASTTGNDLRGLTRPNPPVLNRVVVGDAGSVFSPSRPDGACSSALATGDANSTDRCPGAEAYFSFAWNTGLEPGMQLDRRIGPWSGTDLFFTGSGTSYQVFTKEKQALDYNTAYTSAFTGRNAAGTTAAVLGSNPFETVSFNFTTIPAIYYNVTPSIVLGSGETCNSAPTIDWRIRYSGTAPGAHTGYGHYTFFRSRMTYVSGPVPADGGPGIVHTGTGGTFLAATVWATNQSEKFPGPGAQAGASLYNSNSFPNRFGQDLNHGSIDNSWTCD